MTPGHGPVKHLGARELRLQDRWILLAPAEKRSPTRRRSDPRCEISEKMQTKPTVRWCDSVAAWCDLVRKDTPGSPVLLRSGESARDRLWEDALRAAAAELPEPRPDSSSHDGTVVSVDRSCDEVARVLARGLHRRFTVAASPQAVMVAPPRGRSLILVGFAEHFPHSIRSGLLHALPVAFGLVVATDLPGIVTQVICRLHLGRPLGSTALIIDGISGRIVDDGSAAPLAEPGPRQQEQLRAALARPRALAVLRGHGRGSHAHFRGMVLCGLIGGEERDQLGRAIAGGCRRDAAGLHCKLAGGDFSDTFSFALLPAPIVALLTCASAIMPGEIFPTRTSAALANMEAGAAAVLATNEVFPCTEAISGEVVRLARTGLSIGEIAIRLNDRQAALRPHRPFIVFGDPDLRAGLDLSPQAPSQEAYLQPKDDAVCDLDDVIARWQQLQGRCGVVLAFHHGIRRRYAAALGEDTEFRAALDGQEALIDALGGQLLDALDEGENAVRRQGWTPLYRSRQLWIESAVRAWGTAAVTLATRYLFRSNAHHLLVAHRRRTERQGPPCNYCGATTRQVTAHGDPPAGRTDCPLCSAHQAWSQGGGPIVTHWPARVRAGDRLTVTLRLPWNEPGAVAATIFGNDPVLPALCPEVQQRGGRGELSFEVPVAAAPKAHALQIAAAQDLRLSFYRRLVAVMS